MQINAVRSKNIIELNDDLERIVFSLIKPLNGDIVAITSKVVSLCEGTVVLKSKNISKDTLTMREADWYIPRDKIPGRLAIPTIKNSAVVVAAGVDDFGKNFVLWPRDPHASAQSMQKALRKKFKLKNLGVVITDSHSQPLRRGSIGFALSYFGFKPLRSYLGKRHLTGRRMRMTRANLVDGLAAAAVLTMGEGGEQTPFAILRDVPDMEFINKPFVPRGKFEQFEVPIKEDIFQPILDSKIWQKKKHPDPYRGARLLNR